MDVHHLVKRPKCIWVFICIGEDESDDLWPQLLLFEVHNKYNGGIIDRGE